MSYIFDSTESGSERARRRKLAEALMVQSTNAEPIRSPWQGAAKMAQALMGGIELGMYDKQDREDREYGKSLMNELSGAGGSAPSPVAAAMSAPSTPSAMPPDAVKAIIDANVPEADRPYAYRMAEKESSFNPNAVSSTGAKGLFQFTGGTGKQYGLVGQQGDMRSDPVLNTQAFVKFTNDNREGLRKVLGRDPTPGELAVAHQQGLGGATALLTGQGNVNPANLAVQAGNPKNAADIMKYYGYDSGGGPSPVVAALQGGGGQPAMAGGDTLAQPANAAPGPAAAPQGAPANLQRLMAIAFDPRAPKAVQDRAKMMIQMAQKETPTYGFTVAPDGTVLRTDPKGGSVTPIGNYAKPREINYGFTTAPDGTLIRTNPADGSTTPVGNYAKPENPDDVRKKRAEADKAERDLQGEGATPLTDDERNQYGVAKGQAAYKTRDGQIKFGPAGTTIKNEGTIPPGYQMIRDEQGNPVRLEPIPGSDAAKANEQKDKVAKRDADNVLTTIDNITKRMDTSVLPTTGWVGSKMSGIAGTSAHDIAENIKTIKANTTFAKLNEMRSMSKTGGALGNVSNREGDMLAASIASLEQSQSAEQFKQNLARVKAAYMDIVHGPGNWKEEGTGWTEYAPGIRIREKK